MLTRPRLLVVLDTETTGVDPERDRIVELAILAIHPDGREISWVRRCRPDVPVGASAAVHRITDADLADAPPFADLAPVVARALRECDYAGYNVTFDLRILAAEMERAGVPWDYDDARILDGKRLWALTHPRTLSDYVRTWCGREHTGAHGAEADVRGTWAAIQAHLAAHAQAPNGRPLPQTLDELHALQFPEDAARIDRTRRFVFREDGEPVVNFSKHKGTPLREIDPGFLWWMLRSDFPADAKRVAQNAIAGSYPVRGDVGRSRA